MSDNEVVILIEVTVDISNPIAQKILRNDQEITEPEMVQLIKDASKVDIEDSWTN